MTQDSVPMEVESQDSQASPAKSSLRRLKTKAPPTKDYIAHTNWSDEERKERNQLLSKHFRSLPDAPRTPRSAWLVFCSEFFVKKGSSSAAVLVEAGKAWQSLGKAERLPYDTAAQTEKEQAKHETEKFKSSDGYRALGEEIDQFVLVNRARKQVKKTALGFKEWKVQQSKLSKLGAGVQDAKENAKEAKAIANCVNRIALKLAAAARKTSPEAALPVPPKSAWGLFTAERMPALCQKAKEEDATKKLNVTVMMKTVVAEWAALPEDQKAPYISKGREDTERYTKEISEFKASAAYASFVEKARKLYEDSQAGQEPGAPPKPIAQIIKEAEEKAKNASKLEKKREAIQMRLIGCLAGKADGPPKVPQTAFTLFSAANREQAMKELSGGSEKGEDKADADEEKEDEVEEEPEDEEEDEEDEDEKPKKKKGKKAASGKGGKAAMELQTKVLKLLATKWNEASEEEKAKYKQQELDNRKKYAEELAAFKTSEAFQAFAMEVDEWSKTEEAQNTKKPRKSFKTWKLKKTQSKRAADKLADRERKKAEMAAARERAKFEKAAGKKKGKVAKPGAPPLEKDPFWDECFSGAEAFLDSLDIDVIVGDRIAWAAAQKGGAAGMDLLRKLQRLPFKASSFFRRRSADCPETPLHHALLHKDMEMIQLFAKEMCRSNNATYISQSIVNGVMHFDLTVGTEIWYWPRHGSDARGLIPRTGPSEQDALVPHAKETDVGLKSGDAVFVREMRGMWIRTDRGWFPLMAGNNVQFTKEDPQLTRTRSALSNPELKPVSTGMARGRAFRAKKLRKVNLSRGGAEGNQAFVKDMQDDYTQPRPNVKDAMRWAVRKGLDFKTLAASCELLSGGRECQASDFLGTAVRSGRWELARELVEKMGVGDLYGLNPQHRLALLLEPTEDEMTEMAKRKASITKKSVENFEIMPIHCACINPKAGKAILEAMLAQLGPAAEDQCKDQELRTLVHYAAACETEEPLEVLLSAGMSPHRADVHGLTALMLACRANRPRCVARLLAAKADPMARHAEKNSFHLAVQAGATEALHELVAHISKTAEPAPPPAKKGKKAPKKPKPSWQLAMSSSQRNALHEACSMGDLDMALFLLNDAPATLHKCDKQGRSPLMLAVMNGHTLLTSHLLHRRAIVDKCDTSGNSPLHYALAYGWQDLADMLVKCGHDPDMQNKWRNSPVDVALLKGHSALAAWYVSECPIQPDSLDDQGRTLLSRACVSLTGAMGRSWQVLLKALVEKRGANVNLPDGQGDLPICLAAHACRSSSNPQLNESLKILCAAKADVGRRAEKGQFQGQSAISIALRGSNSDLLRLMLQSGAGVATHGRGETLLHALPERLIRMAAWNRTEEKSAADIFETICACVPADALKGMAGTMEQFGLRPLHSAILHFNQAIAALRAAREAKAAEMRNLQKQLEDATNKSQSTTMSQIRHAITAKEPELQAATATEEAGRSDFQKFLKWLMDVAGADLLVQVGELEKPWNEIEKPNASKTPPTLPPKLSSTIWSVFPPYKDVLDRSVPAHSQEVYFKYHPGVGLATPLMFLIQSGDSPSVAWFLEELTKRDNLEAALKSATLFGFTPLALAVQQKGAPLSENVVARLASPGAAAVRQFDGRTALHLATAGGPSNWAGQLREGGKDSRAVAFQAALTAAKAAGTLNVADASGHTALCAALSANGPAAPKLLQEYPLGLYGGLFAEKEATITSVEMEMYQAFQEKEKEMLSGAKLLAPVAGTAGESLKVAGMGKHIKWGFDDEGAYVSAIKNPEAETNGIKVGMRLTMIESQPLAGMTRQQITSTFSNQKGATAMLTFQSPGGATPAETSAGFGFGQSPAPVQPAPGFGAFGAKATSPALGGAPAFGAPAFGAPAFGAPAFGAPAFGAPAFGAPAFGAPNQGGFGGGGFGGLGQPGGGGGFGFGTARKKVAITKAAVTNPAGFGFGGQPQQLQQAQGSNPEPAASLASSAPQIVQSADACFYSLDAGTIRTVPCQLTQGRWHFELRHTYLSDARIGFAVSCGGQNPEVKWLTDKRPWPTNGTVGIAIDCDAGTAYLIVDGRSGSSTTLASGPGSSYSPVISGRGLCTISFDAARTSEDLPYMPLKEAIQKPTGSSRLVHALLDAGATPQVPNASKPKEHQLLLQTAAQNADAASVRFLCQHGALLSLKSPLSGRMPLHLATEKGFLGVAAALVLASADVNQPDPKELQGHVAAACYAPRQDQPRLALHQAVQNGTDAYVGLLTRAGADVSATIETRTVLSTRMWLPVPPPPPPKNESEPPVDPFRKAGTNVGIPAAIACELLRGLGAAEDVLEKAMNEVLERAKKLGAESSPMFCGSVGSLPQEVVDDMNMFAVDSGDFGPVLAKFEKKKPLLVTREKLMYYTAVESIKKTHAQPLQKAAARNRTAMVQVLLKASADPAGVDSSDGRQALHHAVSHLNKGMVQMLLESRAPLDVADATSNKAMPLYYATTAATQDKLYSSDILEALLKAKANINLPCCSAGSTALHLAASSRHLKVIEQLLRHGALPSARDPEKRTPLHIAVNSAAASEPSFDAERLLLNAQADVNAMDVQGRMPLHYAFVKKEKQLDASPADPVETVTSLCAVEGVRVDVPDEFGATPLLCAARRGATISSLYLSKRGASLKARDKSGNDTLGVALAGGHHQYAITLLSQGAGDVEAPMCHLQRETVQGKTKIVPGPPLSLFREATSHKQLGLSYLLLDHGYPFHGAIQDSLELGEFRLVLTLLSKINPSENAVVQRLDKNRRSLHHALAGFPRQLGPEATEIAEELKRRGVSMASADVHKRWPLHYACANAHKDLSRWLVRQDSSAASQLDEEGQCPVHAVCTRGFLQRFPDHDHLVFMDMLLPLHKEASLMSFRDVAGATADRRRLETSGLEAAQIAKELGPHPEVNVPLVNVARVGFRASVERLLEAHADPNQKDGRNNTSLCSALQSSGSNVKFVVQSLLFASADTNERDGRGNSPLRYAVRCGSKDLIMDLARAKARITDTPSESGGSLILDALSLNSNLTQVLTTLLDLRALPDQGTDDKGRPALLVAVDGRMTFATNALLSAKASATAVDRKGRSALSSAIEMAAWKVADQLLRAGANPHKGLDKKGHGPLLAATLAGVPALVRHLLQAKASTASAGQDDKGRSVLSIAILDNNKEVVDELLSAKADPSHQDKDGRNALHHCIQPFPYASYECTRLLTAMLRAPGGVQAAQAKDKKGLTPMALASRQGSGRMAQVLSAAGLQVAVSSPKLAAPTTAMPDVDADARRELEKVEANAKPTPIPVHKAYSMSGENKVFAEKQGLECDALLFKVDLKRDEMRFYHLQLIHETNKDLFVLFTRWGEIGETGAFQRTPAANKEEGLKDFGKVFKEKTGNVWDPTGETFERKPGKYQLLRRRRATARSEEIVQPFDFEKSARSQLPRMVWRTLDAICDPQHIMQAVRSMGIKTQSMPFGSLSRATLDQARSLLGQIREAIAELKATGRAGHAKHRGFGFAKAEEVLEASKKRNEVRERILELSSRYYELIPRGAGTVEVARPIESDDALSKEFEQLLNLTEASVGIQTLLAAQHHAKEMNPMDYCQRAIGVAFEQVKTDTDEFKLLMDYMCSTSCGSPPTVAKPGDIVEEFGKKRPNSYKGHRHGDVVTAIYRISRQGEEERFKDLGNRRLMWHGSRRSNFVGILTQGLRVAPPEAPACGYMFGKGIYFADMFAKSRGYTAAGSGEAAYMLLCDVALGNMFPSHNAHYMEQPQEGTTSTWGVGSHNPGWTNSIYEPGGAQLPKGAKDGGSGGLGHNEFIVYDPAQVRMRYLIELNNFESPSEKLAREKAEAEARGEAHPAKKFKPPTPPPQSESEDDDDEEEDSDCS